MDKVIHLRFHHQGEFTVAGYTGGDKYIVQSIETDIFSYALLMEYVKDGLNYSEIGGVYVSHKSGEWKLLSKDLDLMPLIEDALDGQVLEFYIDNVIDKNVQPMKQMQPHVIVRPRKNFVACEAKRKFVSSHQLQQQKNQKTMEFGKVETRNCKKLPEVGVRKSPWLNKSHQVTSTCMSVKSTARRKLDLQISRQDPPSEDENMDENESEHTILPPPPPLTEYEIERAIRVEKNNEVFYALNFPALLVGVRISIQESKSKESNLKERTKEGTEDYDPGQDEGSDGDISVTASKETKKDNKKKLVIGHRPTIRSRANVAANPVNDQCASEKEESSPAVQAPNVSNPLVELPQSDDGNGSMAAFWAMGNRQKEKDAMEQVEKERAEKEREEKQRAEKEKADKEKAENASGINKKVVKANVPHTGEAEAVSQRMRAKMRMDKVHTRSYDKRIFIGMNDSFQPIAEDDRVLSELSNFLGTLAKRCVSLTYVNWRHVPNKLKQTMWNYVKARYIIPDELEG